jgi:hypothetical protein
MVTITSSMFAGERALQALIADHSGKPLSKTEVRLERLDAKAPVQTGISNSKGLVDFKNITPGKYRLTALRSHVPIAAILVDAGLNKTTTATLSVNSNSTTAAAPVLKKRKHYVYVAAETGTHIGGGRWVAVEDDVEGSGANPIEKRDARLLNQPQSFQLRPFVPTGN